MVVFLKALLCLHGLLSSPKDFNFIHNKLYPLYDYIHLPIMPGHGTKTDHFHSKKTLDYVIEEYDKLKIKYKEIDVLGYSIGGVLACFLSQHRKIDKLMLIAPAFYYINFENYKPKIIKKSHVGSKDLISLKKIQYFFVFSKIVKEVKETMHTIPCPICIIWGEDDFLVSKKSGLKLIQISTNEIKYFITIKNLNHYNIVYSHETIDLLKKFILK